MHYQKCSSCWVRLPHPINEKIAHFPVLYQGSRPWTPGVKNLINIKKGTLHSNAPFSFVKIIAAQFVEGLSNR